MRAIIPLSFFCLSLILFSCAKESEHLKLVDENELLVKDLSKVEGNKRTYNFDFGILKEPEKAYYYAPVNIPQALNCIPEEMLDAINLPNISDFPFTPGTEMANIVTFWNTKNKLMFQIQISYFENTTAYEANNQDFFIISATQLADNPFVDDLDSDDDPIDQWRIDFNVDGEDDNPEEVVVYRELELTENLPLFYKDLFSNWSTMYPYYSYDQSSDKIIHTSTGSKMYYAWYDGVLFQIGYKFDDESIDMESIVRQIILGE